MRILIPIDGGADCREAIRFINTRKSWLESQKPTIEVLYVQRAYRPGFAEGGDFNVQPWSYEKLINAVFDDMKEDLDTLPEGTIKTSKIGNPATVIAEHARETGADLIVMGARGLGAIKALDLGSVSLGTLAKASCPTLICREHYTPRDDNLKIGITVDGSGFGERCAKFVADNKALFGSNASFEVIYVHADEERIPPDLIDKGTVEMDKLFEQYEEQECQRAFGKALPALRSAELQVKTVQLRGPLHTTLTHYAGDNLDMVVMGSHGKGRVSSLVFGSSTRAMVSSCRMPILIVPGEN